MGEERKSGFGWGSILFLVLVLAALVPLAIAWWKVNRKAGDRTQALSGCKAIAGGLVSFKHDFGRFPDDQTRSQLTKKGHNNLPPGHDANAYLAQLIVTEIMDSETYFHCHLGKGFHKGDDQSDTAENILAPGENSYGYIMAGSGNALEPTNSTTPIVIAPVISGGSDPRFDPELYKDYYVYGAADGSGKQGKIGKDGRALSKGRDSLFQTGPGGLFGKQIPEVKLPTPRK